MQDKFSELLHCLIKVTKFDNKYGKFHLASLPDTRTGRT